MLLKSLTDLAVREQLVDDPSFQMADVHWFVDLDSAGNYQAVVSRREPGAKKGKTVVSKMRVPQRVKRTVNLLADFLLDKPEYALGLGGKRPEAASALFRSLLEECQSEAQVPELASVLKFLNSDEAVKRCHADLEAAGHQSNDIVAFRVNWVPVHEVPAIQQWWAKRLSARVEGLEQRQCLICGQMKVPRVLHVPIKPLAGASTSGVPMISFNAKAFLSYGLENHEKAPVCESCSVQYATALNRCLTDRFPDPRDSDAVLPKQSRTLGDDVTAVYWADIGGTGIEGIVAAAADEPEKIEAMLEAPWFRRGVLPPEGRFHCLLLQGAKGRPSVRGYHEEPIGKIVENLKSWLIQTSVADRPFSLWQLLSSLAVGGKVSRLPRALPEQIYLAVLFGWQLPMPVAALAVARNRVESRVSPQRAALLQAWLMRMDKEVPIDCDDQERSKKFVSLNPDCPNIGYQLGRLLATCERIQSIAQGKRAKTVVDRFYGALSTTPGLALPMLMKLTNAHLGQADSKATWLRSSLSEVFAKIRSDEGIPSRLDLTDQAQFALGYFHQRQENIKRAQQGAGNREANSESERTAS